MDVCSSAIPDVKLIVPRRHVDARGFVSQTYSEKALSEAGLSARFVEEIHVFCHAGGTVHGLHFQVPPRPQCKFVRVPRGAALHAAVDLRHGSPFFGRHVTAELSARNWIGLWIPEGFAHGFWTLAPATEVLLKTTDYYFPACHHGIRFDDPALGIAWPGLPGQAALALKDRHFETLARQPRWFSYGGGKAGSLPALPPPRTLVRQDG